MKLFTTKRLSINLLLAISVGSPVQAYLPLPFYAGELVGLGGGSLETLENAQATGNDIGNDGGGNGGSGEGEGNTAGSNVAVAAVSQSTPATQAVVTALERGGGLCGVTPEAYRLDCLAENYRETAKNLSSRGDYGEVKKVLNDTADKLESLVRKNRDRTKPRIRVQVQIQEQPVRSQPLTAVKTETVATINAQAVQIIEEAETKLLRSASSNGKEAIHYQRIAATLNSNKVLLRSG